MSHNEKNNYISLAATILVSAPYLFYVLIRYRGEDFNSLEDELKFWGTMFLILIPVRIVSEIIMHILAAIMKAVITGDEKQDKDVKDERDKLIELKGERTGSYVFMFGTLLAFVSLVFYQSLPLMFGIFFVFGFFSEVIGTTAKSIYYRMGVQNG
ncbi:MAG TPA: hypothetical protein VGA67_03480 [Candidatus Dojkabacteria bacterium]|jgi:hypothetical protein